MSEFRVRIFNWKLDFQLWKSEQPHQPKVNLNGSMYTCSRTWWSPQQDHQGGPYLFCLAAVNQEMGLAGPASWIYGDLTKQGLPAVQSPEHKNEKLIHVERK